VNAVNDAPVAVSNDVNTDEDQAIIISLEAVDVDGDVLTYTLSSDAGNGSVTLDGSLATYVPDANYNGEDIFSFTVTDGEFSSSADISISVNAVNDPPLINEISDQFSNEDELFQFNVVASDIDGDEIEFDVESVNNAIVWFNENTLNVLPDENWFGLVNLNIIVSDGQLSSTQQFVLTIESVNDIPTANNMEINLVEDTQTLVILEGNDVDNFDLQYTIVSPPLFGDYTLTTSFLTYVPNSNFNGLDSLIYVVSDGIDISDEASLLIEVIAENDYPELPELFDVSINEDETFVFNLPVYDVDNDTLYYDISISNNDAQYIIDNDLISIIPNLNFFGDIIIDIDVTDLELSDFGQFTINVIPVNDSPIIVSNPQTELLIGDNFIYNILIEDPDSDTFIYELTGAPLGMELDGLGNIFWTPDTTGYFGPINLSVTDVDEDAITVSQEFYLDVRIAQNFTLHQGSNLVSYLGILEDNSIESMIGGLDTNISQILTENYAAVQLEDGSWIGSLSYIEPTKGYWLRLDESSDYSVSTYETSIEQVYNLHEGQNLISYIGIDDLGIDAALPDDIEFNFTDIFSENISAVRNEDGEWVGSLSQIGWQQLLGYWVNTTSDLEFSFEGTENLSRVANNSKPDFNINSVPFNFSYNQSQQQSFYYFKEVEIDGVPLNENDWIIAFNDDIVVGARQWFGEYTDVPVMGYDGFYETTGYCSENNKPSFKVLKYETGEIVDMNGNIPKWQPQTNYIVDILADENTIPSDFSIKDPYPNPFNPIVSIDFSIPFDSNVKISIYDISGRLVDDLFNNNISSGYHSFKWDASNRASGIYFVTIHSGDFIESKKMTLIK